MEDELIPIGKIVKYQGRKGQVRLYPFITDLSLNQYTEDFFTIDSSEKVLKRQATSIRFYKSFWIIHFKGINSIDEALSLVGQKVAIHKTFFSKLPAGNYYWFEIIGLDVYDEQDNFYGKVEDVFPTGSNDVYVVKDDHKGELLLPATKEIVKKINLKENKITIHLVEGLL